MKNKEVNKLLDVMKYLELFIEAYADLEKIADDEIFYQCIKDDDGGRYENPAWFVSNYGRVWSFARKKPVFLKPALKQGNGKYYFLRNPYSKKWVRLHRLVALYHQFDANSDLQFEELECHHIQSKMDGMSVSEYNSSNNLQLLNREKHDELTKIERAGTEYFEKKFDYATEKCGNAGVLLNISEETLIQEIINYIDTHDDAYLAMEGENGELEIVKYLKPGDIRYVG